MAHLQITITLTTGTIEVIDGEHCASRVLELFENQALQSLTLSLDTDTACLSADAARALVDGDEWRGVLNDLRSRSAPSVGLESILRQATDWMTNHYEHAQCGTAWEDSHSCACDDECSACGASISPTHSEVHRELHETSAGHFILQVGEQPADTARPVERA